MSVCSFHVILERIRSASPDHPIAVFVVENGKRPRDLNAMPADTITTARLLRLVRDSGTDVVYMSAGPDTDSAPHRFVGEYHSKMDVCRIMDELRGHMFGTVNPATQRRQPGDELGYE